MESTIDAVGRVVIPKALRDALGLRSGASVDISAYGAGLQILPGGRTAALVDVDGRLLGDSQTQIDDHDVLGLMDAARR